MKTYGWRCDSHEILVDGLRDVRQRDLEMTEHVRSRGKCAIEVWGEVSRTAIYDSEIERLRDVADGLAEQVDDLVNENHAIRRDRDDLATAVNTLTAEKRALQKERDDFAKSRDRYSFALTEMTRERDGALRTLHEVNLIRHSCPPPLGNPTREEAIAALREIECLTATIKVPYTYDEAKEAFAAWRKIGEAARSTLPKTEHES